MRGAGGRWLLGLVALLAATLGPGRAAAADVDWQWLETPHFRIAYAAPHRPQADWYAEFVERVYAEVAELLGAGTGQRPAVRLYPNEAAYVEANPLAAGTHHILAHARPSGDEIGLALERLERLPAAQRVSAFRHELSHLVLAERSGGRLSVGWHEGLAQHVENDPSLRVQAAGVLRRAVQEQQLLRWSDFERVEAFYGQPRVAYPQSYAVVAYLADRYGFGRFLELLDALRAGASTAEALQTAFGRRDQELEAEWRADLPRLLGAGGLPDPLGARELAPARRALAEARYGDAAARAAASERLWVDLGRPEQAAEARALRQQAEQRRLLQERLDEGRRRLVTQQYAAAAEHLDETARTAAELGDEDGATTAAALASAAAQGAAAEHALADAREALAGLRLPEARSLALAAQQSFLDLADQPRASEAAAIHQEAGSLQLRLGLGLLGAGAAAALAVTLGRRRGRALAQPMPAAEEELAL